MTLRSHGFVAWTLAGIVATGCLGQEDTRPTVLPEGVRLAMDRALADRTAGQSQWEDVVTKCLGGLGDASLLVHELESAAEASDSARSFAAHRGLVCVLKREGRLQDALRHADRALALVPDPALELDRAHLLDATGDAEKALAAYDKLLASAKDRETLEHVGIRRALLKASMSPPVAPDSRPTKDEPSEFFTFASQPGRDEEFRNRAAVVLAMLGRPKEAIQLYTAHGDGRDRFRQEVRLAEWSLAAKAAADAQVHAWNAYESATVKRDRLFALTILVESHRADKSLPKLIDRFAAKTTIDAEARQTWIDLLRETSRVDEAMRLFRASADGASFTPDMRRQLLEMCREAGRETELVATYRQLITDEPERIEWREGLSRYLLERGDRDGARSIWKDYVARFTDIAHRMEAARTARMLGLEDVARATVETCLAADAFHAGEARLFLAEMEQKGGHAEKALAQLDLLDKEAPADSPERVRLAEALERVGEKKRAADVLKALCDRRGGDQAEEDLEMRLAWLLSETGDEKAALDRWKNLWRRVQSVPRRRQVEDRLMATASRLGVLGDIAVELEEKLVNGTADDRESGLLTRLYGKVGDAVSAAEVVEEHLKRKGKDEIAVLEEKAQVYLAGKDYYRFEKSVKRLIEVDVDRRGDHMRRLAMSNLERGRPAEAKAVLDSLAQEEGAADAAEFEAGALSLSGLKDDAVRAYRRGLALRPERIDGWLLLANVMRDLGEARAATGMFQHLAETADKDDLFTIAIDGVLNMRADATVMKWARRVTLERLARKHDRMYLFQLYADLSDEVKDTAGGARALENALPVAGEQRGALLRELMDSTKGRETGGYIIVNGMLQPMRKKGGEERMLAYGRRLIGLGDVLPPQVFLELGQSFLGLKDVVSASKTFDRARDVTDFGAFRRQVASTFEQAGYAKAALSEYERVMASEAQSPALLVKTGELNETLGKDERAAELYAEGLRLLLAGHPLFGDAVPKKDKEQEDDSDEWAARNLNDFQQYFSRLREGFLCAAADARIDRLIDDERALLDADLKALDAKPVSGDEVRTLKSCPRVEHRSGLLRTALLTRGRIADAEAIDLAVLARFPKDEDAVTAILDPRKTRGLRDGIRRFLERSPLEGEAREKAAARYGVAAVGKDEGQLGLRDVVSRLGPMVISGDTSRAAPLIRSLGPVVATKDDLPYLELLTSVAVHLGDETAVLQTARTALLGFMKLSKSWEDRNRAMNLIESARRVLSKENFDALIDQCVAIVSNDDKLMRDLDYFLVELQEKAKRPLFSTDVIKKRIEASLAQNPWMLNTLASLAPPESRVALLRQYLPKVPQSEQAMIVRQLFYMDEEGDGPAKDVLEFATEFIEDDRSNTDPNETRYLLSELLDMDMLAPAVVLRVITKLAAKSASDPGIGMILAAARVRAGDQDGAIAAIKACAGTKVERNMRWTVTSGIESIATTIRAKDRAAFIAALEKIRTQETADLVGQIETELVSRIQDPSERARVMDEFAKIDPNRVEVVEFRSRDVYERGDARAILRVHEELLGLDKDKARQQRSLQGFWSGRRNPIRAEAAKTAADQGGDAANADDFTVGITADAAADDQVDGPMLPGTSTKTIEKAVEQKREDLARAMYRRSWRGLGFGGDGAGRVFYSRRYGGWGGRASTPFKGGLDPYLRDDDKPESRPATLDEVILDRPWGREEISRRLRAQSEDVGSDKDLMRVAYQAETRPSGAADAVRRWNERRRSGEAGVLESRLILEDFDVRPESTSAEGRALFEDVAAAVDPLDANQLRIVARIRARLGDETRTARILEWCGSINSGYDRYSYYADESDAGSLVDEAIRLLKGDALVKTVDALLKKTATVEDESERDGVGATAIDTWEKVGGPELALKKCESLVRRAQSDKPVRLRNLAIRAARLLAHLGRTDEALALAELALCNPPAGDAPESRPHLPRRLRWLSQSTGINGDIATVLLQAKPKAKVDLTSFYLAFVAKADDWQKRRYIEEGTADRYRAVAFVRLVKAGKVEEARATIAPLTAKAAASNHAAHVAIDAARLLGDEAGARRLEDELLQSHRLYVTRICDVLKRVRTMDGDEATLARAEDIATTTLHPDLVALLIDLSDKLKKPDRLEHWKATKVAAEAAAKRLNMTW